MQLASLKSLLFFGILAAVRRIAYFSAIPCILLVVSLCPAEAKYASMVVDAETGEVLHAVNADSQNYPASLTKMMTLYLLFDQLESGRVHLTDRMPVSAHAAAQSPTKLGVRSGQTLMVEDAILGLCTKSANDAAVVVAESLGGSESAFADMMTRKARELGMRQTVFRNASGLPNLGQVSTARDMVTLARALLHNHPREYHYFSTHEFTYNGEKMINHNHLMEWYEGVDGIKTGYIGASGFNLVASVKRDGRRLIGVVFGGQSAAARDRHMAQLLDAAFARAPGSSAVEMAQMPAASSTEADIVAAPAPLKTSSPAKVAAEKAESAPDYSAVMKAMAQAKANRRQVARVVPATAKLRHVAPPVAAGDADEDHWGIQVGAYAQMAKAKQAATAAAHKLGKLVADGEVNVIRAKNGHVGLYRARVIGLPADTAREACRRLAKTHNSCSVVNANLKVASR